MAIYKNNNGTYAASKKATLRIKRKPGETMEVDWIGDTLKVYDSANCCEIPAYIFVAVLPCSLYGYAEAFPDMKSNHWIEAHVHAYSFFGGVTRILVPDNPSLKNISTILKNGQDKVVLTSESARVSNKESLKYGITRGGLLLQRG